MAPYCSYVVWIDNVLEDLDILALCSTLLLFPHGRKTVTFSTLSVATKSTTVVTVASSQDHSLVKEFLEWLLSWNNTKVIEEFMPETSVKTSEKAGVFCTTYINIDWQPLVSPRQPISRCCVDRYSGGK